MHDNMPIRILATGSALTGSAVLGWDIFTRRGVMTGAPQIWALVLLAISVAVVYQTRRPSGPRVWFLLGGATFMLFLGGRAGTSWLFLLAAGVIHLVTLRSTKAVLLAVPCWVFGLAALFVVSDVTARVDAARSGGQISSSEMAVASQWVVAAGLALWLGRLAIAVGHRHFGR